MPPVAGDEPLIRVAVLGVRGQASRHIKLIGKNKAAVLSHVYHPAPDKARLSDIDDLPITDDLNACQNSDVIIIASPTSAHMAQLDALGSYGGYILLEKPAAGNLADITEALAISKERKSRIRVNFNFQFNPVAQALAEVIDNQLIGKPIYASFETNHGGAFRHGWSDNWRSSDRSSSSIFTVGIHYVHWITSVLGDPHSTNVSTSNFVDESISDSGSALLKWPSGFQANVMTSYASAFRVNFLIVGTDGYVVYDGATVKLYSPRDTFDEHGLFTTPPENTLLEIAWSDAYRTSLELAQTSFLADVSEKKSFEPEKFDRDVLIMNNMLDGLITQNS